jgi:hypothetical protein
MAKDRSKIRIFIVAEQVVKLVQKYTDHAPTAVRILSAARDGFFNSREKFRS